MSFMTIGVTGLNAANLALTTTGHNITNASVAGYNRQVLVQGTNVPLLTGAGFMGQGTNVQTIQRVYSQYLNNQLMSAQTGAAEMDSYSAEIKQIDNLLGDATAGLSPAMADFFSGVQAVASAPSSLPARQSLLSTSQSLVARFQSIDQRLQDVRLGLNSQISGEVSSINSYAQQIAAINQRIMDASAAASNQQPNDLLDQRDQLIANLNKEIRATTLTQTDGTISVFIGNGQPLVVGTSANSLGAVADPADPTRMIVTLQGAGTSGTGMIIPESLLTGGTLGGLISFRNESLDPAQNALGRIAIGLAQNFNDIHRLGQDLTGALGGAYFNVPAPVINADANNASAGTLLSAQIISSDYRVAFAAGGAYTVTRLSDNTAVAAGVAGAGTTQLSIDGIPMTITNGNTAANGDTFIVRPGNAAGSRTIAESDNTGTAVLDSAGSNIQALSTSDYKLDYVAANQFRLTRLSDNSSWTSAVAANPQAALDDLATKIQTGVALSIGGVAPTVGDSFTIQPTRAGASGLSVAINNAQNIAAAAPFRTAGSLTNTGTATISAGSVDARTYLPLPANITLTFNSATNTFAVAGAVPAVGAIAYNPATATSKNISFNGLSFTISGTPGNGDVFTLSANAGGVSDNRNMQMLGGLQTAKSLDGTAYDSNVATSLALAFSSSAKSTYEDGYAQIVSQVGNKAREVQVTGKAQQTLADQAQTARDQMSAVNLDEEAANLLRYQQAYQASAKMFDIAGKLFDQILSLGA